MNHVLHVLPLFVSPVLLSHSAVSLRHLLHVCTLLGIARCYLANHVLKMCALFGIFYCYLPDHMLHVRVLLVITCCYSGYHVLHVLALLACCHARAIALLKPVFITFKGFYFDRSLLH